MAGMTAIFRSIFRPLGFERSSGTVSVPQRASICVPDGDVSAQSSSVMELSGVDEKFPGEQEARSRINMRGMVKLCFMAICFRTMIISSLENKTGLPCHGNPVSNVMVYCCYEYMPQSKADGSSIMAKSHTSMPISIVTGMFNPSTALALVISIIAGP